MNIGLPMANAPSAGETLQPTPNGWFGWSDWVGMVASIGCAIHCAAMPFAIAYLPALGLGFLADEAFHKWMAIGCFFIAVSAFVPGFRKHRRLLPVVVGSCGLVLISIAAFGFSGECCAACEIPTTADEVSMPPDALAGVTALTSESPVGAEECTEACCADKATHTVVAGAGMSLGLLSKSTTPPSTSLAAKLVPWMTSIGGCVLVFAHLMNRRFGCLCGCCDTTVAEVSA